MVKHVLTGSPEYEDFPTAMLEYLRLGLHARLGALIQVAHGPMDHRSPRTAGSSAK